ncbi:MAG TPA: SDR family NAD(P)-dependent oxidoreductase, partial [Acidobacteriaceae bacterium]|nr:SDR family NAD(P)-dependent oxidoreductase [Acidobacteriaceae bacterium]
NPGMRSLTLDIEHPDTIRDFATRVSAQFPDLNVLLNNAGIMQPENWTADTVDLSAAEATLTTNLLGPLRLTAALLPLLKQQRKSTIVTVTSGLAFTPLALTPTYCATKAAIHSWTQTLRHQLRETSVEVLELVPPYVQTELMGERQATDPNAMPLADFIAEAIPLFSSPPPSGELLVKRVDPLRWAERDGAFTEVFTRLNSMAH